MGWLFIILNGRECGTWNNGHNGNEWWNYEYGIMNMEYGIMNK